jgi:hypothetical protein
LKRARVRQILLQLGELIHLGLGAGGVVDGEQEHTCEGEGGKEEGRTGENCARVLPSRPSEPSALSPSAPAPVRSAAAALSPAPPGEVACSLARLFSSGSTYRIVSGPWERRNGR